jgi:rhamnulokinase
LEGTAVGNIASQLIALRAVKDLAEFRKHLARDITQTAYHPRKTRSPLPKPTLAP